MAHEPAVTGAEPSFSIGAPSQALIETTTMGDALLRVAHRAPDAVGVVFPDRAYTFRELADGARRVARGLMALGIERGHHVGILQPNSFHSIATLYGASLAGAVVVPINGRFRLRELRHIITNADLHTLVISDLIDTHVDYARLVNEIFPDLAGQDPRGLKLKGAPLLRSIVLLGEKDEPAMVSEARLDELAAGISEEHLWHRRASVRVRDNAIILYTSGTTSQPSGCMLSHETCVRTWSETADRWGITDRDVVLSPLPMFHIGGVGVTLMSFLIGAPLLTSARFEAASALDLAERCRATVLFLAFPTIVMEFLTHARFPTTDLSAARIMYANGQMAFMREVQRYLPHASLTTAYGSSEQCGAATMSDASGDFEQWSTCGTMRPGGELRIVDPATGRDLPDGKLGEILMRGPTAFDGYYGDPDKTAAAFDADGWFHSQDMGFTSPGGRLTFTGRLKDTLKVGGENVAPSEIEEHLTGHPDVVLAQVVGRPDARLDEVPVAFVEKLPGSAVTETELIDFCRHHIASFKVPREVRFVEEWPMSATKILKSQLREMAAVKPEGVR